MPSTADPTADSLSRPRGLTDKASDFESEDCGFESRRGLFFTFSSFFFHFFIQVTVLLKLYKKINKCLLIFLYTVQPPRR